MWDRITGRLTYANVMSTLAVFGMLATGGAFAASQIGANAIQNGAVTARKLRKNACGHRLSERRRPWRSDRNLPKPPYRRWPRDCQQAGFTRRLDAR